MSKLDAMVRGLNFSPPWVRCRSCGQAVPTAELPIRTDAQRDDWHCPCGGSFIRYASRLKRQGYDQGYDQGYAAGYREGFRDGKKRKKP